MSHPAVVGLLFAAALVYGVLPEVLFYMVAAAALVTLCVVTHKDGLKEKVTTGAVNLALAGVAYLIGVGPVALFLLLAAVLPIGVSLTWKPGRSAGQ